MPPTDGLRREVAALRSRLADVANRRYGPADLAAWDWYATGCPCGLAPGECREHPRARASQRPPAGDWRTWLFMAGRGAGKTRAGAEWVRSMVQAGARRIALLAPTAADCRDTLIEGEGGLLAVCPPWERPKYEPSKRRVTWPNGAMAIAYSAEEPERLRGPNFEAAWVDELGSFDGPRAWDMLQFTLRRGGDPRVCVTTTPRPTALVRHILDLATTAKTTGSTYDNRLHLAPQFLDAIISRCEGTRLGRQEVYAELLEALEGVWFPSFNPQRHVTESARYDPRLETTIAIDCGTSKHTGAVFTQRFPIGPYRTRFHVFGDFYKPDGYSQANALAIQARLEELCGPYARATVRLDPFGANAHSALGPAAFSEYARVFGERFTACWPTHRVHDGLDLVELLLGGEEREPDLLIHPRCGHLINAFNTYVRETRGGEYLPQPKAVQHPAEELIDSLRGAVMDALPRGRELPSRLRTIHASRFLQ